MKFRAYGTRKFIMEFWKVRCLIISWTISSPISVATNNPSGLVRGMDGRTDGRMASSAGPRQFFL
jgi:hypothetical protein